MRLTINDTEAMVIFDSLVEFLRNNRETITDETAAAWGILAEVTAKTTRKEIEEMAKSSPKGDGGKAPNTGSNTQAKSDNKATASGKPVDPNRPHVDRNK